jgi:hypothetical protein
MQSVLLLLVTLMMSGCGSERLLSAQFNDERVGSPPAFDQEVGKLRTGDFGRVVVAHVPVAGIPGNWVQFIQGQSVAPPQLRCLLKAFRGDGRYLITMRLFIPTGMGAILLLQDPNSGIDSTAFFSLEFHDTGQLLPGGFDHFVGRFPRDQVFSVVVNLTIGPKSTVEVTLLAPANGSFVTDVPPSSNDSARGFSQMQLTTNWKTDSTFFANDLSVIYNP